MSDFPLCRTCKQPYKLARESSEWYEFSCELCQVGHVFTKPSVKAAAAQRAKLQRATDRARLIDQWERRPRYFFLNHGGKS